MARPREFDPEIALARIKQAFWKSGFHGTSMQDLEGATGLKKQSLYREFGNKDAMYARALELYHDKDFAHLSEVITQRNTAIERFQDLFNAVLTPVRQGDRSGCFLCNSSIDHAHEDPGIQAATQEGIRGTQVMFAAALAISEPYASDPELRRQKALALAAGYFGLRVMIRGGTSERVLEETIETLLASI